MINPFKPKTIVSASSVKRPYAIGFLLVDGFSLMSFASACEPLRVANLISDKNLYHVRNVPVMGSQAESSNGVLVKASAQIGENVDFDLVFVIGDNSSADIYNVRVMQWLQLLSRSGVALGGVGAGVLMLAKAGLLDGYTFVLHDKYAEGLIRVQASFKRVQELFFVDRDRYSCVGGAAAIDMMHALIESHHGEKLAEDVSEYLLFNKARRSGNISQSDIKKRFGVDRQPILLAIEAMHNNLNVPYSLEDISKCAGVGTRQLNRLFRENNNCGTMQFYLKLRLEEACELLERTVLPVMKIAGSCGFKNTAHFAKVFKKEFGKSPSIWREEHSEKL